MRILQLLSAGFRRPVGSAGGLDDLQIGGQVLFCTVRQTRTGRRDWLSRPQKRAGRGKPPAGAA